MLYEYDLLRIKPAFVQNRFYPATAFDGGLRRFCIEHIDQDQRLLESEPKHQDG